MKRTVATAFITLITLLSAQSSLALPIALSSSLEIHAIVSLNFDASPPDVTELFDFQSQGSTINPLSVSVIAEQKNGTQLVHVSGDGTAVWDNTGSGAVEYNYIGRWVEATQGALIQLARLGLIYRFVSDVTGALVVDYDTGPRGLLSFRLNNGPLQTKFDSAGLLSFDLIAGNEYFFEGAPQFGAAVASPLGPPHTDDFPMKSTFKWRIQGDTAISEPTTAALGATALLVLVVVRNKARMIRKIASVQQV